MNPVLAELGFYVLAGQPTSSRRSSTRSRRRGAGPRHRVHLRALQHEGGGDALRAPPARSASGSGSRPRRPTTTPATRWSPPGYARTMQSLTGGRFVLGIGRGIPVMQDAYGIPRITTAQMEDFAGIMRRLFRGEAIIGHDGPAGSWPVLHLDATLDEHLPMGLVAFGPNTLELGGRCFDEVVLHTYFTDETTERCVAHREGRRRAGRAATPTTCTVWSCFATIGDHIPEDAAAQEVRRPPGHLPPGLRRPARVAPTAGTRRCSSGSAPTRWCRACRGAIDGVGTTEQLEHIATLIPDEWLAPSATGTPEQCVAAVRNQLDLGCDGVIMHGATPTELAPIVEAYRG